MAWLIADCDRPTRLAARVTLRSSSSASRVTSRARSLGCIPCKYRTSGCRQLERSLGPAPRIAVGRALPLAAEAQPDAAAENPVPERLSYTSPPALMTAVVLSMVLLELTARYAEANDVGSLLYDVTRRLAEARKAKDFTRADAVRGELTALGVEILDTPAGTDWRVVEAAIEVRA